MVLAGGGSCSAAAATAGGGSRGGHGRSVVAAVGAVITVTIFVLSVILELVPGISGISGQKVVGSANRFLRSNSCESGVDCPVADSKGNMSPTGMLDTSKRYLSV